MKFDHIWKQPPAKSAKSPKKQKRADNIWQGTLGNGAWNLYSGGGLMNFMTGLGTFSRDKVMMGSYLDPLRITDPELQALFHSNDLASRIVSNRPKEMFRKGYDVVFPDPEGDDAQGELEEQAQEAEKYAAKLRANEQILEGLIFSRLFGGGLVFIGADDGQDPLEPLDMDRIKSVRYLNFVDRRFLFARTWYSDPFSPKYGTVETYQITNAFGDQQNTYVHESRCIRFDGAEVDVLKRRQLMGWTLSVLQKPYDVIRAFDSSWQACANLMVDASQGVFKMKGLMDMISSDNGNVLQTRMELMDLMRSSGRMILADAEDEDFERKPTSFAGIPEMLDRFMQRVAASANEPVSKLFGRSVAGLASTGDAEERSYYDAIAVDQANILGPALRKLYECICAADDGPTGGEIPEHGVEIHFHPLREMTDLEQAQLEKTIGDRDVAYVTAGILHPEEVAMSRFGAGEFSLDTNIDIEMRKKSLEATLDFDTAAKELQAKQGPEQMQAQGGQLASPQNGPLPGTAGANTDPSSGRQ